MTHFSDGTRIGNIQAFSGWSDRSRRLNGMPDNVMTYDITPVTLDPDGISVSASPGAGAILLSGALVVSGVAYFDVPRNVTIGSGGDDSGLTFTVTGTDGYGATQVETITGANVGTAQGLKAFFTVTGVTHTGTVAGTLVVGSGDKFGLPAKVAVASDVVFNKWSTALAADAGTLAVADATSPATATTGDPRGTYLPSSASNGSRKLRLGIYLPDPSSLSGIRGVDTYGG